MDLFVGPRVGIERVLEPSPATSEVVTRFEMARECFCSNPADAAKYYLTEHLLRNSTADAEVKDACASFRGGALRLVLRLRNYDDPSEPPIRRLETEFRSDYVKDIDQITKMTLFEWKRGRFQESTTCPNRPELLLSYVCAYQGKLFILYTANMNWIDGYSPKSSEQRIPPIPPQCLQVILNKLHCSNPNYNRNERTTKAVVKEVRSPPPKVFASPVKVEESPIKLAEEPLVEVLDYEEAPQSNSEYAFNTDDEPGIRVPRVDFKKWQALERSASDARRHREQCDTCRVF